ncbi:hypothetical protein AB0O01_20665 [Streptomyces sp. NPDC093252]|uniref:hypothetical protein n=1 Tax=Streptomyces sp. NPDC093252 TaxID=3154980 RepID=UPI0034229EC1
MNLTPYVDTLHRELTVAAQADGDDVRELVERLIAPLTSATRLSMLNLLSAAMDEITRELAPGSVEVRLRGLDPEFVVTPPTGDGGAIAPEAETAAPVLYLADGEDGAPARVNLRMPGRLKARVEEAAGRDGLSVNAWLVRAASAALDGPGATRPRTPERARSLGHSFTGWTR